MSDMKRHIQCGLLSGLLLSGAPAQAQDTLLAQVAESRSVAAQEAYTLLQAGDVSYLESDFATAVKKYREALAKLPEGAPVVAAIRSQAVQRYAQAALAQAQSHMRKGNSDGAKALIAEIEAVDPDNLHLATFKSKVDDPIRYNPTLTPEHTRDVERVRHLLYKAQGYFDSGLYDRAKMTYEDVLHIDAYNKAARRGMEKIASQKSSYLQSARDHTRSDMLTKVAAAWELQDHKNVEVPLIGEDGVITLGGGEADILTKLNTIIIPEVDLNQTTLSEALDYLRAISIQLDNTTLDESKKGISIVEQLGDNTHPAVQKAKSALINLQLRNVPLGEVIRLITAASGTTSRIDNFAVIINTAGFDDPTLIRREFKVPPDFLLSDASVQSGGISDPFADAPAASGLVAKSLTAEEKLKSFNVGFPEGASASFSPSRGILTVRNSANNIRLIQAIVDGVNQTEPVLVSIKTTILEVTQTNLDELGFDTILNQVEVGSNGFLSGGTTGSGSEITDTIAGNPVSSGLRSGVLGDTAGSIDGLIAAGGIAEAGSTDRASSAINLQGVIDGQTHQILMRGLSQKTGVDIMVQPAVTTRPGQAAQVESIMEFPYPDSYEPPELPNTVTSGSGAVTPSHPTDFTFENVGVLLDVVPQVGADRKIIELAINPRIVDFEGFVNYGSPILGGTATTNFNPLTGAFGTATTFGELTENVILKPIFRKIDAKTSVRILDGQTIVLSGLLEEKRDHINDKVPILGDLPLVGRIFRNDGVSVVKRNIVILVNVELVDPAGNRYRDRQ